MLIIGHFSWSSAVSVFSLKHVYKDKTILYILDLLLLVIIVIVINSTQTLKLVEAQWEQLPNSTMSQLLFEWAQDATRQRPKWILVINILVKAEMNLRIPLFDQFHHSISVVFLRSMTLVLSGLQTMGGTATWRAQWTRTWNLWKMKGTESKKWLDNDQNIILNVAGPELYLLS